MGQKLDFWIIGSFGAFFCSFNFLAPASTLSLPTASTPSLHNSSRGVSQQPLPASPASELDFWGGEQRPAPRLRPSTLPCDTLRDTLLCVMGTRKPGVFRKVPHILARFVADKPLCQQHIPVSLPFLWTSCEVAFHLRTFFRTTLITYWHKIFHWFSYNCFPPPLSGSRTRTIGAFNCGTANKN